MVPLNRSEFPAKLAIAISAAKGANIPTSTTVSINNTEHQVALNKGKGTLVLFLPSGATYEISATNPNWSCGSAQTISLKKSTTLRIQLALVNG